MIDIRNMERNAAGRLPAFTSVGAYTLLYVTNDGQTLCAGCASKEPDDRELPIIADTYDEGPVLQCDDCNADIASSYWDPDSAVHLCDEECGDETHPRDGRVVRES